MNYPGATAHPPAHTSPSFAAATAACCTRPTWYNYTYIYICIYIYIYVYHTYEQQTTNCKTHEIEERGQRGALLGPERHGGSGCLLPAARGSNICVMHRVSLMIGCCFQYHLPLCAYNRFLDNNIKC